MGPLGGGTNLAGFEHPYRSKKISDSQGSKERVMNIEGLMNIKIEASGNNQGEQSVKHRAEREQARRECRGRGEIEDEEKSYG